MRTGLLYHIFHISSTKSSLSGWVVADLKVKVSFPSSMLEVRCLVDLGILSGGYLGLSSWYISLAEKLAFSGSVNLVADMATDAKRSIRQRNLGLTLILLSISGLFCFYLVLKCVDLHILKA